jgi:hypothetical protein
MTRYLLALVPLALVACGRGQPMTADELAFQRQLFLNSQANRPQPGYYSLPAPQGTVTTQCNGLGNQINCTSQSNQGLLNSIAHPGGY